MKGYSAWVRWGLLGTGLLLAVPSFGYAQAFSSGSTGADGAFSPTCTPTPCTVTVALPPSGIFNFTTINIPASVTVKFTRNAANTPVILLATGNVTISGMIDVSGDPGVAFGRPGRGGPGGFEGGAGADGLTTVLAGFGFGPGGGAPGNGSTAGGGGGGYLTAGTGGSGAGAGAGGPAYGSAALRPILGGSGGGGGGGVLNTAFGGGGGGGGGAIVVASSTSITLNFQSTAQSNIRANGGSSSAGGANGGVGGGGSGGAIRVIAPTIAGNGQLLAGGGSPGQPGGGSGASGRIRIEASTLTYNGSTTPPATSGLPQPVFPGTGQPTLTISSVGGIAAPATPVGSILAAPDILLPTGTTNPVEVVLTASNIPLGTAILVTATPQSGARTTATSTGLTGSLASSTATASITLSLTQTSVLTASATFPLVALGESGPTRFGGEPITHVRVAATYGGPSTVTYITASGREVPAEALLSGVASQ